MFSIKLLENDQKKKKGQLSIIAPFKVYVSKIALEGESHKNDIH